MKIICIGRNYVEHIQELHNQKPTEPVIFLKPETALLENNKHFTHPDFSKNIHHEIELVLKISKYGKNILIQEAKNFYDEITVGIDFTARDIQDNCKKNGLPWEKAKAFDGSAAIGRWIPKNNHQIVFHLDVNRKTVQLGDTEKMIFSCDQIIAYVSHFFTLEPNDLIFTGTPAGVDSVKKDDLLEGYCDNEKLFAFSIR